MSKWPKYSEKYENARDFRANKRREVREALLAVNELRFGCVYTPAHEHIISAAKHLEAAKSLMSIERWKR